MSMKELVERSWKGYIFVSISRLQILVALRGRTVTIIGTRFWWYKRYGLDAAKLMHDSFDLMR